MTQDEIALWEFNEAFSVVVCAVEKVLGLSRDKINVKGGAVALGHVSLSTVSHQIVSLMYFQPIGSSGSRVVVTLVHALKKGEKGVAAICNGGGAATAIVIERL